MCGGREGRRPCMESFFLQFSKDAKPVSTQYWGKTTWIAPRGEGGGKKADGFFRIGELVSEIPAEKTETYIGTKTDQERKTNYYIKSFVYIYIYIVCTYIRSPFFLLGPLPHFSQRGRSSQLRLLRAEGLPMERGGW